MDEHTGDVEFLYKFEKGATLKSEGLFVAKMALVPDKVLKRAQVQSDLFREKLKLLEKKLLKKDS